MEWNQKQKAVNDDEENIYEKYHMKIKFNSDDDLPLNEPLKFNIITIIIKFVFEEDGQLYPQVFNSTDESKELLKKYADAWNGIKNKKQ